MNFYKNIRSTNALVGLCFFFAFANKALSLDYFWVNGSGNWSEHNTHWAKTSGGAVFHDQVPTSMDNVYFDANSGFSPGNNVVTIDQTIIYCMDMDWTNVNGNPSFVGPNDKKLYIFGSIWLSPVMSFAFYGETQFQANQAGKVVRSATQTFLGSVRFIGTNGEWSLADDMKTNANFFHFHGIFRTNDKKLTVGGYFNGGTSNAIIYLGSSEVIIEVGFDWPSFGYLPNNFNCGTSNIIFTKNGGLFSFGSNLHTFYNVTFQQNGSIGNCNVLNKVHFLKQGTLNGLNYAHEVMFEEGATFYATNQVDIVVCTPGKIYNFANSAILNLNNSISASGTNCGNLTTIKTFDGQAFINKPTGTVNLEFVSLTGLVAGGGANFVANNCIDFGGNIGWAITPFPPRNLYWVGGNGTWSQTAHWSLTSGGVGVSCPPTIYDDVFFDSNSGFLPGDAVAIDVKDVYFRNMDWTGVLNNPSFTCINCNFQNNINQFGSLKFAVGVQNQFNGNWLFLGNNPTNSIQTAGVPFKSSLVFNGSGEWGFADNFNISSGVSVTIVNGTVRTNNHMVSSPNGSFFAQSASKLYLGTSDFHGISMTVYSNPGNYDEGTAHFYLASGQFDGGQNLHNKFYSIHFTNPNGAARTYNCDIVDKVVFEGYAELGGGFFNRAVLKKEGIFIDDLTVDELELTSGYQYKLGIFSPKKITITPTGSLIGSGSGCNSYVTILSSTPGAQAVIYKDGIAVQLSFVRLMDIKADGAASFTATNSVDLGNNPGWTITGLAPRNLFWVNGGGNWSDPSHWSITSGGPGGECAPNSTDNVRFDANSGFVIGQSINVGLTPIYCNNIDFTGVVNNPSFGTGSGTSSLWLIYGSLKFDPSMQMVFGGETHFKAIGTGKTIFSAGKAFLHYVRFSGSGAWSLQDEFKARGIYHSDGNLNSNGNKISIEHLFQGTGGILNLEASVLEITMKNLNFSYGEINLYYPAGNFHGEQSELRVLGNSIIRANEHQLHNVNFLWSDWNEASVSAGSIYGALLMEGNGFVYGSSSSPIFIHEAIFKKNGSFGHSIFENLTLTPGKSYNLIGNITITPLGNFTAMGTGAFPIEIKSISPGVQKNLHKDGDPICLDFLYLTDTKAEGSGFSYAGANSDDVSNNDGWIFAACPVCFAAPPLTMPMLSPASVFNVQPGGQATLILDGLIAGFEAVWLDATQSNELYAGTANFFQPTIPATTTFYGGFREISTGCVSQFLAVTVCAAAAPVGPTDQGFCFGSMPTIANLTPNASDILWYDLPSGGLPLASNLTLATGTYYGARVGPTCESARLAVSVNVQNTLPPPGSCMQSFCASDSPTVASLVPNGAGILWYNEATGGSPLSSGTALVNGGNYYATQTVGGCESTMRLHVMVGVVTPAPGHVCIGGCSN